MRMLHTFALSSRRQLEMLQGESPCMDFTGTVSCDSLLATRNVHAALLFARWFITPPRVQQIFCLQASSKSSTNDY